MSIIIVGVFVVIPLIIYKAITMRFGETLISEYPPKVAEQLKRAIYWDKFENKPQRAIEHYQEALKLIHDMRLDPMTNAIIGVKIELAQFYIQHQQPHYAVSVLETVLADCQRWLKERGDWPGKERQRTRVLRKACQVSALLAELYAGDYFLQPEKAEERLVWTVETIAREETRRREEGVKEEEQEWLTTDEMGAEMEAMAHHYEKKNAHYLAAPLFLQAITYADPKSCHMAVLMNNLSICLAQQQAPPVPGEAPTSRPALVANAREWASKAIQLAANISPPERNEECDLSCAVATHNLAEFAEMDGDIVEARKRYEEARSLAKALKFKEGVVKAEKALERLSSSRIGGLTQL